MKKQVGKIIIVAILGILVLELGLYVFFHKKSSTQSFEEMEQASFPVVRVEGSGGSYSDLYGFTDEMETSSIRNTITPLNEERELMLSVYTYGHTIDEVGYQIRSLDGEHLIDDVKLETAKTGETISIPLKLTNLLEENTEYTLIISLNVEQETLRYFNRIIYGKDMHVRDMLDYVLNFSESTFDKKAAEDTVVNVVQIDGSMGEDDFSYINIHSKFNMFTWGSLAPVRTEDPEISIMDISDSQMAVTLNYPIEVTINDQTTTYDVEESFRVSYRSGKIYLPGYERYVKQRVKFQNDAVSNNAISLGIGDGNCSIISSEKGEITAIVYDGQLWSYEYETGVLSCILAYEDNGIANQRRENHSEIQVIDVKTDGTIDFVTYGYRDRGRDEGTVGIYAYRYHPKTDDTEAYIEEMFNIPVNVSEDILKSEFGDLIYLNENDVFYFQYGRGLYSYSMADNQLTNIVTLDTPDAIFISADGNTIAWEEQGEEAYNTKINLLNTATGEVTAKEAEDGTYFQVQGFIQKDLVYGIGRIEDIKEESGVVSSMPMYAVEVLSPQDQQVLNHYEKENIFIVGVTVEENRIVFERISYNEDGSIAEQPQDYLLLGEGTEKTEYVTLTSSTSDVKKKEYALKMKTPDKTINLTVDETVPQFLVKNHYRTLKLEDSITSENCYYVIGFGGENEIKYSMKEAIELANENQGIVLSRDQKQLWKYGTRSAKKELEIEAVDAQGEGDTLQAVIEMIVNYEEIAEQTENTTEEQSAEQLSGEDSALSQLAAAIPYQVVNLAGCDLENVLYYVDLGSPVIVIMGNNSARLITAYTATDITFYDPLNQQFTEMPIKTAETLFERTGNSFISYVK